MGLPWRGLSQGPWSELQSQRACLYACWLKSTVTETYHRLRAVPGVREGQTTFLTGGLHSRPGESSSRAQRGGGALIAKQLARGTTT